MFPKTSIIILGWNQVQYSVQCIQSIKQFTRVPYELILVDNGSTDDTYKYFSSVSDAVVIRNKENRGFAGGCNQGIQAATGQNILLLNNDTIVSYNWLSNMLNCLHSKKDIGIVSCYSNCVGSENYYPANYASIEEYHRFALDFNRPDPNRWRQIHSGWLSGFCLLIKREVIWLIGGLDEQFQYGCEEDVDFCRRTQMAGYKLYLAGDTFVHHYGNRTFAGNGLNLQYLIKQNKELGNKKWNRTPF